MRGTGIAAMAALAMLSGCGRPPPEAITRERLIEDFTRTCIRNMRHDFGDGAHADAVGPQIRQTCGCAVAHITAGKTREQLMAPIAPGERAAATLAVDDCAAGYLHLRSSSHTPRGAPTPSELVATNSPDSLAPPVAQPGKALVRNRSGRPLSCAMEGYDPNALDDGADFNVPPGRTRCDAPVSPALFVLQAGRTYDMVPAPGGQVIYRDVTPAGSRQR
jgi:hypothetical protein